MRTRRFLLCAVNVCILACSTQVAPSNPFDPGTPDTNKAKARIRGTIAAASLASAAGLAALQIILKENLVKNAERVGAVMLTRLEELKEKYRCVGEVRLSRAQCRFGERKVNQVALREAPTTAMRDVAHAH